MRDRNFRFVSINLALHTLAPLYNEFVNTQLYKMAKISNSNQPQIGITSQINMEPRIYRRWDQVPRGSKHPLLTGHTRREPSFKIMNAELFAVKSSVPSVQKCDAFNFNI
jgi:hypothetical protein